MLLCSSSLVVIVSRASATNAWNMNMNSGNQNNNNKTNTTNRYVRPVKKWRDVIAYI